MPRKLTKNAARAAEREADRRIRHEFKVALRHMEPSDKVFLADVLNQYFCCNSGGRPGELGIASAFEGALTSSVVVVLDDDEYTDLIKRLEEAEAFRRKVTVMPARDAA